MNRLRPIIPAFVALLFTVSHSFAGEHLKIYKQDGSYHLYHLAKKKNISKHTSASKIIQIAIDKLEGSGGTVELSRGGYVLEKPIALQDGVYLVGQGRGTELRSNKELECLVKIDQIQFAGLSRIALSPGSTNTKNGVSIRDANHIRITDVIVFGFQAYGILLNGKLQDLDIIRCRLTGNRQSNLFLDHSNSKTETTLVKDCIFLWGGCGIMARSSKGLNVESTVLYHTNGLPMDIECDNFSVKSTRIFIGESNEAALKYSGTEFEIRNNIMGWVRGDGFHINDASDGLIRANCIIDLGPPPRDTIFKSGIVLRNSENIRIQANAIWNWDDWTQGPMDFGIDEGPNCDQNLFEHNNIHFYRSSAIRKQDNQTVIRNNVTDPGRDDGRPLMDFNVWVDYVEAFIADRVSMEIASHDDMQDYIIHPSDGTFDVVTSVTGEKVSSFPDAAEAIQWAIDHTETGGGIELAAGTFPINAPLQVPHNIWLHGNGNETVLITEKDLEYAIILDKAYNTMVSDFVLEQSAGAKTGMVIYNSIFTHLHNVTIKGFIDYGLHLKGDTENAPPHTWGAAGPSLTLVSESRFINNQKVNIYKPVNGGYIGNAVPTLFSGNIIWGGEIGIDCKGICDNIVGNIVCRASQHAYVLDANSILLSGNMAYQTKGTAVRVFDGKITYSQNYDRNDNNNNKEANITGNYLIYQQGTGIEMSEQWGTITDNRVLNSGAGVGYKSGIWLHEDSESYAVADNYIYNAPEQFPLLYGITEYGAKNLIAGNKIHNYSGKAVKSMGDGTLVIGNHGSGAEKKQEGADWKNDSNLNWKMTYSEIWKYLEKLVIDTTTNE